MNRYEPTLYVRPNIDPRDPKDAQRFEEKLADITVDPIYRHLREQDEYWRKRGGRDSRDTDRSGFAERWEQTDGPR